MNKRELAQVLRAETGLAKNEAGSIVNIFFDEMTEAVAKGGRVEVRGLCSFFVKKYKAYAGRNPKTGGKLTIKSKKLPFFKCGKDLKDRVKNKKFDGSSLGQSGNAERRNGKDRRKRDATVLAPDRRKGKDRRN